MIESDNHISLLYTALLVTTLKRLMVKVQDNDFSLQIK
jgi:hypothetical protein